MLQLKENPQCQEPPSGKSTTTEEDYYHNNNNNRMWGQLSTTCSIATEGAQWGAPSCSQDGRSNCLAAAFHPTQGSTPRAPRIARYTCGTQITRLAAASVARTRNLRNATRQPLWVQTALELIQL